ncbi:replication-associated recombination protein A [Candidatus Gracilibacteria bacterium]|nr:replication-associated recombination protein A [Candidatus Gracilibacteria bacterium]MCF7856578.1 replication-associated recombination protein A [Candidatus Gracilibacteria bacterium]MCF7896874.1 replication-associated recombination protein A [Candidatus Gracilibacteria bacterium]
MVKKAPQTDNLFDQNFRDELVKSAPLADRMRPRDFVDFVGQQKIVGEGSPLRRQIELDSLASLILWGPPGSGKTTLAKIISTKTNSHFQPMSAIGFATAEFRKTIQQILERRKFEKRRTILFVDEIHRLNRAQQDQLLPYLEKGVITLIGATTENPSFELNSAILSRSQVYVLNSLEISDLKILAQNAIQNLESGLGKFELKIEDDALERICELANGDARILFNILERAAFSADNQKVDLKFVEKLVENLVLFYDKKGEEHYNLISALHKSMRDGDADAAIYWLARMLESGEDPLFIARRVVRFASEDVGIADPLALQISLAAKQAVEFLGLPEADTALGQAVVCCARAEKSNSIYVALGKVRADIQKFGNLPVPLDLRNAPTKLMKDLKYGANYKYFHSDPTAAEQQHLPDELTGRKYLE